MMTNHKRITIGFQSLSLYGYYYQALLRGICDEIKTEGANLLLFPGRCYPHPYGFEYQNSLIYNFMSKENIDGLIVTPGSMIDFIGKNETLKFYDKYKDIPSVSLNIRIPGAPVIEINNVEGFRTLIEHLLEEHGFRRPAFIHGPAENEEAQTRFDIYKKSLQAHAIPFDERMVAYGNFTDNSGSSAAMELIKDRKIDCDVIIASNDAMAIGAMDMLSKSGKRVPNDIAVTGFDNLIQAASCIPPLSTVAQPLYEQAKEAVRTIIARVRGETFPDTITFDTVPIIRASCGCLLHRKRNAGVSFEKSSMTHHETPTLSGAESNRAEIRMSPHSAGGDSVGIARRCRDLYEKHCSQELWNGPAIIEDWGRLLVEAISTDNGIDTAERFLSFLGSAASTTETKNERGAKENRSLIGTCESMLMEFREIEQSNRIMKNERILSNLRFLIRDCSAAVNLTQILDAVRSSIASIGIENCYIMLFDPSVKHENSMEPPLPEKIGLIMAYPDRPAGQTAECVFAPPSILPDEYFPEDGHFIYVVTGLYLMAEQYGYMLMDYKAEAFVIHEILATQISTTYKRSLMFEEIVESERKLRSALSELKTYTHHLQDISERDELTGLYNRRGFVSLASAALEAAYREGICVLLFFFDLDGLKRINDTHGHEEGDFALKSAASILRRSFRTSDILGRLGGDEFVAFSANLAMEQVDDVIKRVGAKTDACNLEIKKSFSICLTCGWAVAGPGMEKPLSTLLHEADKMLYRDKREKGRNPSNEP
jgi:diguanylate cyclase (GGDEF)-like protein